jgi:membrane associated rhomboid family serine protease
VRSIRQGCELRPSCQTTTGQGKGGRHVCTSTRVPALIYIGFWFITQFCSGIGSLGVATVETGGVAYWAHIGGFVAGLVLVWLYKQIWPRRVVALQPQ